MRSNRRESAVDILIPTCNRAAALAVTLTALASQDYKDFRVVISDQGEPGYLGLSGEVQAVIGLLRAYGIDVEVQSHLPSRGMAEQRHFLLEQARAPYVLFLDDDIVTEPTLVGRMLQAIREEDCGFVGSAVIGLSFVDDVRPQEQQIEFWNGRVQPEYITWEGPGWERHRLHNAANLYHVAERLGIEPRAQRKYKVAWVGGCVLYHRARLLSVGGFSFWSSLPPVHCGEDVLAQFRVMNHYGGCGIIPSGAYHLELPTTLPDRRINAPQVLPVDVPLANPDSSLARPTVSDASKA